jgi:hypothetical protein
MAETTLFKNLAVNTVFIFGGDTYKKTDSTRVSCCKSINALKLPNNERVFIPDSVTVEIKPIQ